MWKQFNISQQTYFTYCNFNTSTQDVTFVLYDLAQAWSQSSTFEEVKQKVKFLNRRFDFSDDNIKEALSGSAIQSAVIEEQPDTSERNLDGLMLKIVYRFKNCLLNYEWSLTKQNIIEFQKTFVQPLLLALFGCHQQVEILKSSICKKDMELKQFQIEGAVLNRKTLITKPFDLEDFNKTYEDCNKTVISFMDLATYVDESSRKADPERTNKELNLQTKQYRAPNENLNEERNIKTRMSPGHKKRKLNDLKMQRLEHHLKIRKKGLKYDSSQSQTSNSENCKTVEGAEEEKQKNSETNNALLLRRSSRLKKPDNKSSDDKTDSDNDDHIRNFTKNITGKLVDVLEESSKEQVAPNSKRQTNENPNDKCENALNPSYSSRRKSLDSSCVFDITTDTDDDVPLTNRRNLQKNRNDVILLKENKLTKKGSILSFKGNCGNMRNTSRVLDYVSVDGIIPMGSQFQIENSSHTPPPAIINEISSQLNNIKRELESLEAMRLADLKQRMCKT